MLLVGELFTRELRRIDEEAELRTENAQLSQSEQRSLGVFDLSCVAMAWGDVQTGLIIRANRKYCEFTGYSESELLTLPEEELSVPEDRYKDRALLTPLAEDRVRSLTNERRYLRKDGKIVWGERTMTVVQEGALRYAFGMVQDITERKRARDEIAYLAAHDSLTDLMNRLVFHARLGEAIADRQPGSDIAALYLGLDEFKDINDAFGHPMGDAILVEVAARLRACVAKTDALARLGGDEFGIMRPNILNPEDVRELAQEIIDLFDTPFEIQGRPVKLSVGIGIALGPRDGANTEELSKKAAIALHEAKAAGRGAYRLFVPGMEERLIERQALKVDLAGALSGGQFEIHYQPVVDLITDTVLGFEALLRWRHPTKGSVSPAVFIPLAEETGLIVPIGEWVLNQACREATAWPGHITLAVNISPEQFKEKTLPLRVATALSNAGLAPARLEIEITESVLLDDSEANLACMRALKLLGVKIALDDFGTGYSSLAYLQRFPFDRIKIDKSFVNELVVREETKAIIRAVIGLGQSLGMRITAEGIETEEQLARIRAKGCSEAQGFLFSRAVPAIEIPGVLERFSGSRPPLRPIGREDNTFLSRA